MRKRNQRKCEKKNKEKRPFTIKFNGILKHFRKALALLSPSISYKKQPENMVKTLEGVGHKIEYYYVIIFILIIIAVVAALVLWYFSNL